MKNILKPIALGLLTLFIASCYNDGKPDGKVDSVANRDNHAPGGATTVDTLPKTLDTAKTDTSQ